MDPEVPKLGSGAQPADRLVRGSADGISIRKENAGTAAMTCTAVPAKPYSISTCSIAKNPQPYSGGRVWAEPTERAIIKCLFAI